MYYSIPNRKPQFPFPSSASKSPNETLTAAAKFIQIIDLTQDEDDGQIQSPSVHKNLTSFLKDSKEALISNFVQRREEVIKKITQISQQTEDEEQRVSELRRLIFIKPRLQEAICIQNLLKNTDSIFSRQILQDLTSDIELSFKCLQNLQGFYNAQRSLPQAEKYIQTSRMIESTWQRIYRLSVYDPQLISQVSKLEWIFRSFEVLNHNRTDGSYPYIQCCEVLKKGVLASQSNNLRESKFYKKIEEELQRFQSLIQKVSLLLAQERDRDSAKHISKMGVQEVKELLQEMKEFGFGMKQHVQYVEEILNKSLNIVAKFNEFLRKKALISTPHLLELLSEIDNFPVRLTRIEEHLIKLLDCQKEQVTAVLQETAQRIAERNNEVHLKYVNFAKERTIKNGIMISGAEEVWKACGQEVQKITKYSEELMQGLPTFLFEDFSQVRRQITERGHEHIKAELWLAQMRLLQIYCESLIKPSTSITFEEIYSFLPEIKEYINRLPRRKRVPYNKQIDFLQSLLHEIKIWIGEERDKLMRSGKRTPGKILYGFIDVTREITKPAEKQQKPVNLKLDSKEHPSQLPSLNGKRSRIDDQIQEIDLCEKIEKKMKTYNEIHQSVFCSLQEEEMKQRSQPTGVKIEELDEKQILNYR